MIIILITIICALIAIKVNNKNIIQNQLEKTQKLTATREENSFVKTTDHLSEVNSGVQSIWESIRNSEVLSSRTDSSGNSIYGNVTDIESLENAISIDNNNFYNTGKIDRSADSSAVTINYHQHSDSCYKNCGGTIGTYGLDNFGTAICKCMTCGHNYTYEVPPGYTVHFGANG